MRNEVEMTVEIENTSEQPVWTECDVTVPEAISLAPDRQLLRGRLRIGIINPREILAGKCKVFAGVQSYPDNYTLKLTAFGFGKDGTIVAREEKKVNLRCERLGR